MDADGTTSGRGPRVATALLAPIDPPEVDEFDLDLRLGELSGWWLGMPLAAQTDAPCPLPTGGRGAGGTCDTHDNTCAGTCACLASCPHTDCGATCPHTDCGATCQHTDCGATCPQTDCGCHTDFCTDVCPTQHAFAGIHAACQKP